MVILHRIELQLIQIGSHILKLFALTFYGGNPYSRSAARPECKQSWCYGRLLFYNGRTQRSEGQRNRAHIVEFGAEPQCGPGAKH